MAKEKDTIALESVQPHETATGTYTAAELAGVASIFGTQPEVVVAALAERHMTTATEQDAKQIIAAFLKRITRD